MSLLNPVRASPSNFFKIHFNIILPHRPRSYKCFFSSGLPTKTLYAPLSVPSTCHVLHPYHSSWFDYPSNIWWGVEVMNFLVMYFSLLLWQLFLLGPNILLSTLPSNILSLRSSLNVRDQSSHPYKTGKIIVLFILICIFFDSKQGDKRFCTEWWKTFLNIILH